MTRELLEQYPDIIAEIEDLKNEMQMPVVDSVSGSMPEPPYTQHSISIAGVPNIVSKRARLDQLESQRRKIEDFVSTLPYRLRKIAKMKAYSRMSWNDIAAKMGHKCTKDGIRMQYKRIFK